MGSIWTVGRRAEAEAAKLTQPFQGIVSLGTGFLSGFFYQILFYKYDEIPLSFTYTYSSQYNFSVYYTIAKN